MKLAVLASVFGAAAAFAPASNVGMYVVSFMVVLP
jgi:hypothetical protein